MVKTSTKNKLDFIEKIQDGIIDTTLKLIKLSKDRNAEVRMRSLETLVDIRSNVTIKRVREALFDKDELVRVTALETIGYWQDKESNNAIKACLLDKSVLVRMSAVIALADLGAADTIDELEGMIDSAGEEERVCLYYALYRLEQERYFIPFINGLFSDYYRTRCATANLLFDLVSPMKNAFLSNLLQIILKDESSVAAKSSMEKIANEINKVMVTDKKNVRRRFRKGVEKNRKVEKGSVEKGSRR